MAGARHFSELIAWQLADRMRVLVFGLTGRTPFDRDLKARSQLDDAVNSVCRNIAEGFGCDSHREFARFLSISRRSLNELLDGLIAAVQKGYVTQEDVAPARALSERLYPAISNLKRYLSNTDRPPRPGSNRPSRRERNRTDKR